ncbi:hypothetical protein INR49_001221, partial [Caranx melampygus]
MSQLEVLRGFVTERLTAASQEILAAVDRVVAGYEAEASGFRQEIERQRNLLDVLLQPRVVLNKTDVKYSRSPHHAEEEKGEGLRICILEEPQPEVLSQNCDQQLLMIKVEDPPELTTSLDQENPESLHIKEEKQELLTTAEFPLTSVHVKSEDEEDKPPSSQ